MHVVVLTELTVGPQGWTASCPYVGPWTSANDLEVHGRSVKDIRLCVVVNRRSSWSVSNSSAADGYSTICRRRYPLNVISRCLGSTQRLAVCWDTEATVHKITDVAVIRPHRVSTSAHVRIA